ncbi:MAG TPA: GNAT family N-acetyltransferase [Actinomycetota bacterium]|nr:GNAT family N-acetyltransferase [Actinomycetota bacterium]
MRPAELEEFVRRRTTTATLQDGTRARLRPIVPDDKGRLVAAFERLSPESRYRRFMAPIAELTEEQLIHLTEVDYRDHFAWVALSLDEPGLTAVGVSRYVRAPDEPDVAEAAVTVVDDYHGRGLGRLLLEALGAVALENGIRWFRGYVLEDNRPMRELLEGMGARMEHDSAGLARMELELPKRASELRASPMYEVLRAVASGHGPVFLRPETLSEARRR